jgi:hypothetical protein
VLLFNTPLSEILMDKLKLVKTTGINQLPLVAYEFRYSYLKEAEKWMENFYPQI